jgi:hypothetical protein
MYVRQKYGGADGKFLGRYCSEDRSSYSADFDSFSHELEQILYTLSLQSSLEKSRKAPADSSSSGFVRSNQQRARRSAAYILAVY